MFFPSEPLTLRFSLEDDAEFTLGDYPMKRRRWSGQEIQTLTDRYSDEGPVPLALEMGRSEDSISSFAKRCGLRKQRKARRHRDLGHDSDLKKTTGS